MYLKSLELTGFKSFAERTVFTFAPRGITAIVGPNGSGKSCVADAIRWGLTEQSLKTLRAKKTEELIFAGSKTRIRAPSAEVSLTFDNIDRQVPIETSELTVTRRAWRDGTNEYLLGQTTTRLLDLQLLLADARSTPGNTTIIAQGMVDQLILATPAERKLILDEAAGIRPLQIKRQQATTKLASTETKLNEAEIHLAELMPRVRSLKRQISRWEKREEIKTSLRQQLVSLYKSRLGEIESARGTAQSKQTFAQKKLEERSSLLVREQERMANLEKGDTTTTTELEKKLTVLETERKQLATALAQPAPGNLREKPLTLPEVGSRLKNLVARLRSLSSLGDVANLVRELEELAERIVKAPANVPTVPDVSVLQTKLAETEKILAELNRTRNAERQELFKIQHALLAAQRDVDVARNQVQSAELELASLNARREAILEEARRELPDPNDFASVSHATPQPLSPPDARIIERLRHDLAAIGEIDDQTKLEYNETSSRAFDLDAQITDLKQAIRSLRGLERELDREIHDRFNQAFQAFADEFERAFKILFNGGTAKLILLKEESIEAPPEAMDETEARRSKPEAKSSSISGIDIKASPPGKKVTHIGMLSGGERALTAIALLAALIATNPSPFIVLDEVDAALDEANTERYARIIEELSVKTQFIVITHNRVTMEHAKIIYGVTMGPDGASKLLSLKLEDAPLIDKITAVR